MRFIAGLMLAAIAAMPAAPLHAQTDADLRGISTLLDPLYADAPTQDVLGVRIGMTVKEAMEELVIRKGFTSEKNWVTTARGFGDMRALKLRRDAGDRPASEYVILYLDMSDKARVMAVYRNSQYVKGRMPKYYRVLFALDEKYGDTDLWDTRPNEAMAAWHTGNLSRKCRAPQQNFRYLRSPEDASQYEGCFRGLAVKVGWQQQYQDRPVEYTRSFLVDARIIDAHFKEKTRIDRRDAAAAEQNRRDRNAANRPAEF